MLQPDQEHIRLPSFIIAGAAKSGTTTLSKLLDAHPDLFLPEKEMNYFAFAGESEKPKMLNTDLISNFDEYASFFHFPSISDKLVCGEKSVSYMYHPWAERVVKNMLKLHPLGSDLKIIIILRQPVERMYSQYIYNRSFHENLSFEGAIKAWEKRKREHWVPAYDYVGASLYSDSLKVFMNAFRHVKVLFFEDLRERPGELIKDLYDYLGVNRAFTPEDSDKAYNVGGVPKNKLSSSFVGFYRRSGLKKLLPDGLSKSLSSGFKRFAMHKPALDRELKKKLIPLFRDDIGALVKITKKDLSHWLKV